jgi:hypothetical protein
VDFVSDFVHLNDLVVYNFDVDSGIDFEVG